MLFQIALFLFALGAILKTWGQFRKKEVSHYSAVLFTLFWLAVVVVVAIPNSTNILASFVGIGRGADLVLYSAMVVMIYVLYRLFVRQQKMSREFTALIRSSAIEKAEKPNHE